MNKKQTNQNNSIASNIKQTGYTQSKLDYLLSFLPLNMANNTPSVAVLRLDGVIGKAGGFKPGLTISSLNQLIEKMFKIKRLDAICLCINSPGGSPVQSELIANRIVELGKENDVPVFSFVEDVAASGGYWLACAGEKIYVSQSSIVGSIGVISSGFGFQETIKKLGIERRIYTEGKSKSVLDPFLPAKESDIKIINKIQKEVHRHFINTVKERRSGRITQDDDIIFNGEFWSGQTAVDYGLADGINNLYSFIQERYGDNVKIEYIENKQPWLKSKLGMAKITENFSNNLVDKIESSLEDNLISRRFKLK